jgi:hypothetical protein
MANVTGAFLQLLVATAPRNDGGICVWHPLYGNYTVNILIFSVSVPLCTYVYRLR